MKKVRAVIYSDVHIENWKKFNEHNRRTENGKDVIKRIKMVAKTHKADILFLGDLLHREKNVSNGLLSNVLPFFQKMWKSDKTMTYAITGNHDQSEQNLIGKESPSYIKTLSQTFPGIECLDFKSHDFGDWEAFGVPYITHDLGLLDYINSLEINPKKVNVLMLHTTIPGTMDTDGRTMVSHLPTNNFDKAIGRFDIVLCGHIHKPLQYKVGKTEVVQVGSPQHQRFTDRNCDMGYWLMYDNFKLEFVHMKNYPRFVELKEGEQKPDNKNFYVAATVKKKSKVQEDNSDFDIKLSGRKLARNYCKEKKIKDKNKRRALTEVLKQTI